jgi:hypothetical protein
MTMLPVALFAVYTPTRRRVSSKTSSLTCIQRDPDADIRTLCIVVPNGRLGMKSIATFAHYLVLEQESIER